MERIDPDWQWTRYRKVDLSRDDGPRLSYAIKYRPASEAATLHRSFAKAFADQRFKTTEIKNRALRKKRREQFLEHWLSSFGKLTADENEFNEFEFNKEAGFVWWIVQVFNLLREEEMDPTKVGAVDAYGIMIDVPNPAQVSSDGDDFFPFQRAALDPPPAPVTALDGTVNDHSSYIRRNIPRDQETWSVNYAELIEVLGLTISKKLQDGVKLTFESLDRETLPAAKGSGEYKSYSVKGFPFLDVQRGRFGSRSDLDVNPLDYTYKIEAVLQPKDLLTYIWMLCAEELTELPDVDFEPCKNFDECGNVLKRSRFRACQHCNKMVIQRASTYVAINADYVENIQCLKSPTKAHEVRKHRREWCAPSCQSKKRAKTAKVG